MRSADENRRWKMAWLFVPAGLFLAAAANAHLVYAAVMAQPDGQS